MYLKSIEVQGFKSFANKIKFDFHDGITGIVGPNGSGKSNVADAVRWVLGEQRAKQLRGGSMQDVIFSGTQNRKPQSYTSVAITLDNSDRQLPVDCEEVTVTRKLYRSGESEYRLNGAGCRLKDIQEIFYDTGIGKEGYSIIGQGQIEKILSGKPEDRRELFDEAAGIVKFKRRKQVSLKKLEEEASNLTRVNDILSELEKQVAPLQHQAEKARSYLNLREDLKRYEINAFLLEIEQGKEGLRSIEQKLAHTKEEQAEATKEYEGMKQRYESLEDEMDQKEHHIQKAREQLNETVLLKQQLEGQIDVLKEQITASKTQSMHSVGRLENLGKEQLERKQTSEEFARKEEEVRQAMSSLEQSSNVLQEELKQAESTMQAYTKQLESYQIELRELLNERASTMARLQHYDTTKQQMEAKCAEYDKRAIENEKEQERCKTLQIHHEEQWRKVCMQMEEKQQEASEAEAEIATIQEELTQLQQQLQLGQTAYHRESSRLESLKNLTERYDGYGNSIRKVMTQKDTHPGLIGVVADVIRVDKQYEIAIETALGGSIQNILTEDEETAKQMISYLKKNRFGRATFLPLTSVRPQPLGRETEVLREVGVIGTANTLVSMDARFQKIADQLLGRTVVVDDIDHAIAIARKYKQTLRLVTKEGELFNPGGAMTGGAYKNTSSLLSRRREVEELEETVTLLQKELQEVQQKVSTRKAKKSNRYHKIDEIHEQLREWMVEKTTQKMQIEQLQAKQKELQAQQLRDLEEKKALRSKQQEDTQFEVQIQEELTHSKEREAQLHKQLTSLQQEMGLAKIAESDLLKRAEEARLSKQSYEQQQEFLRENQMRLRMEHQKLAAEIFEVSQEKEISEGLVLQKEEQIEQLLQTIENSKEVFQEIEQEIERFTKEKESLQQHHKSFLERREACMQHLADLDKEAFRLNNQMQGLDETMQQRMNYMWDEYEMTYNHANSLRDSSLTSMSKMKEVIGERKAQMKQLGDVNVNAIEEFHALNERYTFLKGQHEDLVEAKETLLQIIEDLDQAMRKQFTEQFAEISKEYDQVFKQLFGGGKGTLELIEDTDVLEAGIRIIAQPPGKKLQNMMQLSGGEKALTAIALLFAIQNLKPSPFCILDEIEAALDDSNVGRFAKYLHKLTRDTQFIVITHRRGTMSCADRLYGITMQEKGVSTLVSVDLEDW
jgi:chromosome segregation protein